MPNDENTLQSANILIVDDDPAILRLFSRLLEQGGHKIRKAEDGNQALHMILQDCPEVLITDWMMPGLDGLELCRRVRQLHQRKVLPHYTYILFLTARTGKNYVIEGLEAGADDFVEKSTDSISNLRVEIHARLKAALRTRKLEKDLEFAAKYDAMTKLYNRITFYELAQVIWDRSIKNKFPLSVIMFDCDFFKRINDIHGHLAGDAVLREMATIMRNFSRTSDLICRYGGEEFCVLLPGCNEKTAWNWAERIRKQFEKKPIKYESLEIGITISFGVAERMDDIVHLDQLIERADQAMLFAKEAGRNRSVCFSETISEDSETSAELRIKHDLFGGVMASDIMVPIALAIQVDDPLVNVVDFLIKSQVESLPVVDSQGHFIGTVSEKNFMSLIGNTTRWGEPIRDIVTPNVISYPEKTPLRIIFDFLCRVSIRQVVIVRGDVPVGILGRGTLLRWMRNKWASVSGQFEKIVPSEAGASKLIDDLSYSMRDLQLKMDGIHQKINADDSDNTWETHRFEIIALVSQLQDLLDHILRNCAVSGYCSDQTAHSNGAVLPRCM